MPDHRSGPGGREDVDELAETFVQAPLSQRLLDGKYELLRLVGRGGMGSVWEARHLALGTHVAVKLIEADLVASAEAQRRFAREARAAARIDSEHAIKILDNGVADGGRPYIVMELLHGESLGQRLERVRSLSLEQTAECVVQLARGLAQAHGIGIIHRDLKPDNVFLVGPVQGDIGLVKLLDFGIAKVLEEIQDLSLSARTMAGTAIGTPPYMSPEQARGLSTVDHRTDLWSLGVLVFRCLTGRDPFEGSWPGALLVQICEAPLPRATAVAPSLPAAVDDWFRRALARDVRERFQSATELAERFVAMVAGAAREQTPTTLLPRPLDPSLDETGAARLVSLRPRHTVRMKAAAPMASVPERPLTTGSSSPAVLSLPPSPSSSPPPPRPRGPGRLLIGGATGGVCVGLVVGLAVGAATRSSPRPSSFALPPLVPSEGLGAADASPALDAAVARDASRPRAVP